MPSPLSIQSGTVVFHSILAGLAVPKTTILRSPKQPTPVRQSPPLGKGAAANEPAPQWRLPRAKVVLQQPGPFERSGAAMRADAEPPLLQEWSGLVPACGAAQGSVGRDAPLWLLLLEGGRQQCCPAATATAAHRGRLLAAQVPSMQGRTLTADTP